MTNPVTHPNQWAYEQNKFYEKIAANVNVSNAWHLSFEGQNSIKHVIAAAYNSTEISGLGALTTGYVNEVWAAYQGRDGYDEHAEDLYNNTVGVTLGSWLTQNLGRSPTLDEIQLAMRSLYKTGLISGTNSTAHGAGEGLFAAFGAIFLAYLKTPFVASQVSGALDAVRADIMRDIAAYNKHCFPAHTQIATSLTSNTPISDLRMGDVVLAFDPCTDDGRGAFVPRRVTKLYSNTTTEWIKLTWVEVGVEKELVATPGHHFLDQFGNFPPIEQMIRDGRASVVLACGSVVEVAATRIAYSAATADQFECASRVAMSAGNTALAPQPIGAWATYNFEVEDLHTYVAGGVCVHNVSIYTPETSLGHLADQISGQISNHIWGANSTGAAFYGSALSAVTSTAADAYNGRADFNAAHLGGRYVYEVAGSLGAMGGSLLAQDLISGLGIRGNAAAALTQLGSGLGSVLAQFGRVVSNDNRWSMKCAA